MHGDFYHAWFISSVFFLQDIAPLLLNGNRTVQGETQLASASLPLLLLSPEAQGHMSTRQAPPAKKKQTQSSEVCN